MKSQLVTVLARDLSNALADAIPRRRKKLKPVPVSLEFYEAVSQLAVNEAKHGGFQNALPASGQWPHRVQVDGVMLEKVVATYSPDDALSLVAEPDALLVLRDKSSFRLPRFDGPGKKPIKHSPAKPDPRHQGMPEGVDAPLRPDAPQSKTWRFSAHMARRKKT